MTSALYTNTAIENKSWNSRGLILHKGVSRNAVVLDNGWLYVFYKDSRAKAYVAVSKDNGFSWQRVASIDNVIISESDLNIDGLNLSLIPFMKYNGREQYLAVSYPGWVANLAGLYEGNYRIYIKVFKINEDASLTPEATDGGDDDITIMTNKFLAAYNVAYNDEYVYFISANLQNRITVSHTYVDNLFWMLDSDNINYSVSTVVNGEEEYFFNNGVGYADDNRILHILATKYTPNVETNDYPYTINYLRFDADATSFTSSVIIKSSIISDPTDLNLTKDGYGNLIAFWTETDFFDGFARALYSISKDNGASWSTPADIPLESDNSDLIDAPTGNRTSRTVMLPCLQGAIFGYVRNKENKAVAYVSTLTSEDGINYELSDSRVAASHPTKDINGLHFFQPSFSNLYNIDQIGEVRFAYQIGQGNNRFGADTVPVTFAQKLLKDEAYPESLSINRPTDSALNNQLLCSFNLLGSTSDNVDYYAQGLIGILTNKYLQSFNRFGTTVQLERYEPEQNSYAKNASAYYKTETAFVKIFVDELTYALPQPTGNDTFNDFIERDTRQIHLPPNYHLGRTFLINDGGYLNRTVWKMTYGGNQYELTQVVPKFVDNQIAYYTANAYVIGPSRDPFSRTILPSET